jgi:hypothetical protein
MEPRFRLSARHLVANAIPLVLIVASTLMAQSQDGGATPRKVMIKRGQVLELSLITPLDSGQAKIGDEIRFRLTRPLMADGVSVLPADFVLRTGITDVVRAGKCNSGSISWWIDEAALPDGGKVKLLKITEDMAKPHGSLAEQIRLDPLEPKHGGVGGVVRGIAHAPVALAEGAIATLAMIAVVFMPTGPGECHRGKEMSIAAGTIFYEAIAGDVPVEVH